MKTITLKDFEKIKTAATRKTGTIPNGHCRIKEETYHRAIIDGCNGAAEIVPIHKGAVETAKTYNGYRKTSILALIK